MVTRILPILSAAIFLTQSAPAFCEAGRFRTALLAETESEVIRVRYGRITVLSFEEAIKERWNPLPKAFIDHLSNVRNDLLILPTVNQGEANLVVLSGNSRFHFTLRLGAGTQAHDEVVRVKRKFKEKALKGLEKK